MKSCSQCKCILPLNAFDQQSTGKQGRRADCKECRKRFTRTKEGLVKSIYAYQKSKSKKRGYIPPNYTEIELYQWLCNQPQFDILFVAWETNDFDTQLRPSVDRVNDYVSYTLNNIQVMTWAENNHKGYTSSIEGRNTKRSIAIDMLDMDGNFIRRFYSVSEAARQFNGIASNIIGAIQGRTVRKKRLDGTYRTWITETAYGHKWRYSTILNDNKEKQDEEIHRLGIPID